MYDGLEHKKGKEKLSSSICEMNFYDHKNHFYDFKHLNELKVDGYRYKKRLN